MDWKTFLGFRHITLFALEAPAILMIEIYAVLVNFVASKTFEVVSGFALGAKSVLIENTVFIV